MAGAMIYRFINKKIIIRKGEENEETIMYNSYDGIDSLHDACYGVCRHAC